MRCEINTIKISDNNTTIISNNTTIGIIKINLLSSLLHSNLDVPIFE